MKKWRVQKKLLLCCLTFFCISGIASATGSIGGDITDMSSNGVSGARVMAYLGGELEGSDKSEGGAYLITGLTAGTYELRILADGYEYRIETNVVVTDSQQTIKDITNLAAEGIISGKATLSDGTTGVLGVLVSALLTSGSGPMLFANSDSSGDYSIKNLPAGTYNVQAYNSSYLFADVEQEVVTAGSTTSGVNFSETACGTLTGTVTDGSSGLEDMMVYAFQPSDTSVSDSAFTSSNGSYSISLLPVGTYTVRVLTEDYNFEDNTGNSVTSGQTTSDVDLTGTASGKIAGKVTRSDGTTAISDADLIASKTSDQSLITSASTDANGDYELKGLATGTYNVTVFDENGVIIVVTGNDNVSVTNGSTTTLNLSSVDGAISGTVEDSSQSSIEDALVCIVDGNDKYMTETDSNGDYTISGLSAGTYNVEVLSGGTYIGETIEDVTVQTNTETADQDFTLETGGTISGTVSSATGAISGASVTGILDDDDPNVINVLTDENGNYSVGGFPTATYILVVQADNYVSDSEINISVTAGQNSSGHNFTLGTSGGTISGTVYESDETTPIENASVSCYSEGKSMANATTDSNGDYSLLLLQAGTYEVSASAEDFDLETLTNVVVTGTQENSGNDFSLDAS